MVSGRSSDLNWCWERGGQRGDLNIRASGWNISFPIVNAACHLSVHYHYARWKVPKDSKQADALNLWYHHCSISILMTVTCKHAQLSRIVVTCIKSLHTTLLTYITRLLYFVSLCGHRLCGKHKAHPLHISIVTVRTGPLFRELQNIEIKKIRSGEGPQK